MTAWPPTWRRWGAWRLITGDWRAKSGNTWRRRDPRSETGGITWRSSRTWGLRWAGTEGVAPTPNQCDPPVIHPLLSPSPTPRIGILVGGGVCTPFPSLSPPLPQLHPAGIRQILDFHTHRLPTPASRRPPGWVNGHGRASPGESGKRRGSFTEEWTAWREVKQAHTEDPDTPASGGKTVGGVKRMWLRLSHPGVNRRPTCGRGQWGQCWAGAVKNSRREPGRGLFSSTSLSRQASQQRPRKRGSGILGKLGFGSPGKEGTEWGAQVEGPRYTRRDFGYSRDLEGFFRDT